MVKLNHQGSVKEFFANVRQNRSFYLQNGVRITNNIFFLENKAYTVVKLFFFHKIINKCEIKYK